MELSEHARRILERLADGHAVQVTDEDEEAVTAAEELRDHGLVEVESNVMASGDAGRVVRLTERGREAVGRPR
jgi:uncharacterized protein YjhX (UPF0386 family)